MMTREQNDALTRVGPGTPARQLLRKFWQPIVLAEELSGARPLKAVRVLGLDLIVFRGPDGRLGLLDRDCPHRGADLAFGRLEHGGVRCLFHGWLFDVDGRCMETPGEPAESRICSRVRQKAYPVQQGGGIVFGFLGDGEPPALPALDCFIAPDSHVFAFKGHLQCNWLQAVEVGIDPAHASFLHRFFEDENAADSYGKQFRAASADSNMPMTKILRDFPQPRIEVESSDIGLRITALREIGDGKMHVRVTNLLFPQAFVIPMSETMTITQWHVPVDDVSCYWFAIFTSFGAAVDKTTMRDQRLRLYTLPDYLPRLGRFNDYGFNLEEQERRTYTGMGEDINVHDQWAVESQGEIQDRTREHLGLTDKAIVAFRKMLLGALKQAVAGERVPMELDAAAASRINGPATMDGIGPADAWQDYWRGVDARRREGAQRAWGPQTG
ncbi:MAG TPA: aromatic ring-hydroxylating dioxygenase subunit alpha [Steroidobacteraceae bacterium]|nr:aromatic ring-hydroxylating dioxygenase subunit alpha [Steroidobacteraceae bacterium]